MQNVVQSGTDGMGHQLDARLCFLALEYLSDGKIQYLFTPMTNLEHTTGGKRELDLVNEAFYIETEEPPNDARKQYSNRITNFIDNPNPKILYEYDNPWDMIYSKELVNRFDEAILKSPKLQQLRDRVHSEDIFNPGHSKSEFNVAVHIRRTDAGYRISDEKYFLAAIDLAKWLNREKKPIKFYVDSDDFAWSGLKHLENAMGQKITSSPRTLPQIVGSFATADVLICSNSSLSWCGVFLRKKGAIPALCPSADHLEFREKWTKISKLVRPVKI